MEIFFLIAVMLSCLWGYICRKIADKNGRDKNLAFLWGFIFGIFAIIFYAIMGQTKEERIREIKEISSR